MDRIDFNRLPLKPYNLTVTCANWTTSKAVGVPYQTAGGLWRMFINIEGTFSVGATTATLVIAGIGVTTGSTGAVMAIGSAPYLGSCQFSAGNAICNMATSTTQLLITSDVMLSSKPTWME